MGVRRHDIDSQSPYVVTAHHHLFRWSTYVPLVRVQYRSPDSGQLSRF